MKPTNLLRSALGCTVSCDKCTVDGFEVANLISDNVLLRQKGALLEHFIRPPVNIDFTLPCPSDVAFVRIKLAKASIAVQRLQIWAQSSGQNQWVKLTTVSNVDGELLLKCGHILPPYLNVDTALGQSSPQIVKMLRNTVKLRIMILSMKNCVAVGLPGCEALGVPSRHVQRTHPIFSRFDGKPKSTSNLQQFPLTSTAHNHGYLRNKPEKSDIIQNSSRKRQLHEIASSSSAETIPEEFLDSITVAVMTIPVVLPSGNIVDQSTLDKYVAIENRWGRPASDPFTGVPLRSRPPVLPELKSRIDHFLSSSGSALGVRVADGRNVTRPEVSRLVSVQTATAKRESVIKMNTSYGETGPNVSLSTDSKTAFAQALATARRVLNRGSEATQADSGTSKKIRPTCANCDSIEATYKLTCGHVLCRSCVILDSTSKCRTCGTESLRTEIVKINLVSNLT
ncbi:RING finger protein 37-like [Varroa destructor]|uniref:U-box domain-containing protein n=1 Tax=Varroa destructor TaxID=109461 RepID=A0A7M7J5T6_VARDE|nr:RING finger protein 37-like [Varroa destructor]